MNKILIATTNPGKFGEFSDFLKDLSAELVSLKDLGITEKVEETGKTFKENAVLKAVFYAKRSNLPTLADDGGFEIDALGGEPGVRSHRWIHSDREDEDEELIQYTISRMKQLSRLDNGKRGAQLRVVVAFALPSGFVKAGEAKIRGIVAENPSKARFKGFPYRSLLYLPEIGKFYNHDELTDDENERYNHRKKALGKIRKVIISKLIC